MTPEPARLLLSTFGVGGLFGQPRIGYQGAAADRRTDHQRGADQHQVFDDVLALQRR